MPSPCGRRCLLVACVAYGLFANHWARDSLGALEVPLESDAPYSLSARRYNALTSLYFLPNIGVPILAGVLAHRFGAAATYAAFFAIAAAGNGLVGASVAAGGGGAFGLLLVGRALMGIAYEAVDVLPIGFVSPRFRDTWTALVGLLNGVNRLGSVTNFLLEPLLYRAGGLPLALSVPSAVGASGLLTALLAWRVDASLSRADEAAAQRAEEEPLRTSLRSLPRVFFLFLLGGACVYGAVVPFWFIGAKHLQSRFGMPLATADALLLLPEGMIALVAPPFGLLMDRRRWSLTKRLYWSAASLAPIPVALLLLAWLGPAGGAPALGPNVTTLAAGNSPPPAAPNLLAPALATLVLGTGYAFAQNLIWASLTLVAPPKLLNLCSGLTGSSLNLLPSALPLLFFGANSSTNLTTLAAVGAVGVAAYSWAAVESTARDRPLLPAAATVAAAAPLTAAPDGDDFEERLDALVEAAVQGERPRRTAGGGGRAAGATGGEDAPLTR